MSCAPPVSTLDTVDYDLGGRRYLATGDVLPDAVLDELRGYDAILLGAVGTPDVPPGVLERGLLLKMRFELDLYVNLRPFKPVETTCRLSRRAREHRGHVRGRRRLPAQRNRARDRDAGFGEHAHGRRALRAIRVRARAVARPQAPHARAQDERARRSPAICGNAPSTMLRRNSPTSATAYNHVDAACIYFVQDPQRYDVIVTDNLFGDILTDLGGAIAGGIGRAASANLNPARTGPSPLRAGARLRARYRRSGQGRPACRHHLGGDDVRFPRRNRRRGPNPQSRRANRR